MSKGPFVDAVTNSINANDGDYWLDYLWPNCGADSVDLIDARIKIRFEKNGALDNTGGPEQNEYIHMLLLLEDPIYRRGFGLPAKKS
jgi:hypothetical protein